jgi:hypothetical protein
MHRRPKCEVIFAGALRAEKIGLAVFLFSLAINSAAGPREQAKRMHDRLTGVPPTEAVLAQMATEIQNDGNGIDAAYIAMDNQAFYSATLKNMAAPWTNRDQDPFVALNDYIATFIGIVRDGHDFRRILYDDILYIGNSAVTDSDYSPSNNNHYEEIEANALDLSDPTVLVEASQTNLNGGIPAAGVMTSRAAAAAFFYAGTNRAMLRFTLMAHLCRDLEQLEDTTGVPDRIRQDVSRSPGGDSRLFMNGCVGCHAGMDPLAQAFAYYNFDESSGRMVYNFNPVFNSELETNTRVQSKYHINASNFSYGYVTPNDSWDNYWREGPNANLGWSGSLPGSGAGASSMGRELANSRAFAQCQVKNVFTTVCLREPGSTDDQNQIIGITDNFMTTDNYDLRQVFARTADYCKGD